MHLFQSVVAECIFLRFDRKLNLTRRLLKYNDLFDCYFLFLNIDKASSLPFPEHFGRCVIPRAFCKRTNLRLGAIWCKAEPGGEGAKL